MSAQSRAGAWFLQDLDVALTRLGGWWARHMDDIVVLTPTRWTLRRAVRVANQVLASLGLRKHPAMTFIGRIARGFDGLGYRVSPAGLRVAQATVDRFVARARWLYEQQPGEPKRSLGWWRTCDGGGGGCGRGSQRRLEMATLRRRG